MASEGRRSRLDRDGLARRLAEVCLLSDGSYTLRSGATSSTYFDKYRFEADPVLLASVARFLAPMVPEDIDVLGGLELGGVPVATALSLATGLPAAYVRKVAKTYGTARLAEGEDVEGRHVLVVEDVISSGGQVIASTQELRRLGAIVEHAICVVDRGGAAALAADDVKLHTLFTLAEIEAALPEAGGPDPIDHEPSEPTEPRSAQPAEAATADVDPPAEPSRPLLPRRASASRPDRKVAPKLSPRRTTDD